MEASPAARRILLTGVTSSTRLLARHVLQSLGYRVDETADAAGSAQTVAPAYALVVAGPRALDASGCLPVLGEGGRPVPVIVVGKTASAGPGGSNNGGRRVCLAEPLEPGQFLATVQELTARLPPGETDPDPGPVPADEPVDLERLNDFAGNDQDLVAELSALYFTTARLYLADMTDAWHAGADSGRPIHALKGASANFGAHEVAALALAAETHGLTAERLDRLGHALGHAEAFMTSRHPLFQVPA